MHASAAAKESTAEAESARAPTVPHLFVQRLDALPEPTMEQLLLAMDRLGSKPQPQQQQQRGWLSALFGGGGSSGAAAGGGDTFGGASQQPGGASRPEVRRLLQQWRQQELAADADTADYSSEPYDSIPRQVPCSHGARLGVTRAAVVCRSAQPRRVVHRERV